MTMPLAATAVKNFGCKMPIEMSDNELDQVVESLKQDLPGQPIEFIRRAVPDALQCECGAVHLNIDDIKMNSETRQSLVRLLATPFGDVLREQLRRQNGLSDLKFGWSGLETIAPSFIEAVERHQVRGVYANKISSQALAEVIMALRHDMPGVVEIAEASANKSRPTDGYVGHAVTPEMVGGREAWDELVGRLMTVMSTPMRKFVDEWLTRHYGVVGAAVNCCFFPTMTQGSSANFAERRWQDQVAQQLTPDC